LKILLIEAFYGGSHKNFADNLISHSCHEFTLFTLPEKNWKWRVRCGALYFLEKVPQPEAYDLIFLPGMINLADLKAHWGDRCPPVILYLHETQLSYPLPPGKAEDYHPYFTEFSNCIHADSIIFNSHFHKNSYISALENLMDRIPEMAPRSFIDQIKKKSRVIYPGIDIPAVQSFDCTEKTQQEPVILWNHRWDYDKDPEAFFRVLRKIDPEELPYRLVLLGENAQFIPRVFEYARERYGDLILQYGWANSREDYLQWLYKADMVISTAQQENFGISIAEAAALGCFPLLPHRLVYPELVPEEYKEKILYRNEEELQQKIRNLLEQGPQKKAISSIMAHYHQHRWVKRITEFDNLFDSPRFHCTIHE